MTFRVLFFSTRKSGVTPDAFKDFYETKHTPLLKQLTADKFPQSYTRRYIQRKEEGGSYPAAVIIGSQDTFSYDVIAEMSFADTAAFQEFITLYQSDEVVKSLSEIEKDFMDTSKAAATVVGDVTETTK